MRRRFVKSDVKARGSTPELHLKLANLRVREESGIPGVEVKSCRLTVELPLILINLSYCEVVRLCSVAVKGIDIT